MTQMRIGNQTAFIASPFEPFNYAQSNGFDAFEWFPDKKDSGEGWLVSDIDDAARNYIKDKAREHNIALSVHASTVSYPYSSEGWEMLWKDIHFAEHIGAVVFNIHFYKDQGIETYANTIMPLITYLGHKGIKLSIENTPYISPHDFNELFGILRHKGGYDINNAGICLDLGHANICESTRNNYIKFIDKIDSSVSVVHLHLHENYGDYDSHLPLFTGPAGRNDSGIRSLIKRLKKRSFHGSFILEQWPEPRSLLNQARDRLMWIIQDVKVKNPHHKSSHKTAHSSVTGLKEPETNKKGSETPADETVKEAHESEKILYAFEPPSGEPINQVRKHDHSVTSDEFVNKIMHIDETCQSWREKLMGICELFKNEGLNLTTEQLVYIAIYLRFLGTGEVVCVEDGRHYRPHHHARMSQEIQEKLAVLINPENSLVIRKIYPWLPSYDSDFMRSEPLTRIRDIAHRNDIPQDLKKEIKHSLQNKLHRCAGPEDLITTENILRRITAPGADYSPSFVEQFRIFHKELKEFFNARSLEEWLKSLSQSEDTALSDLAQRFLQAKKKTEEKLEHYIVLFKLLTELRDLIQSLPGDRADARTQKVIMTDIELEDYAFVLLSKMINQLEASKEEVHWKLALYGLALTVHNLRLSGVSYEQCRAIEAALRQRYDVFDPSARTQLLIVKATLDRCRLLAEEYSNRVMNLFFEKADILGRSLGVPDHALRVYCEGDIRGNIVFQLSKLVSWLLKKIREEADLPPWDIIVPGTKAGFLTIAESLPQVAEISEEIIVLLKRAQGDEEIPRHVKAIILCHELPHLSHLAVRARQKGVVLVTCEDENILSTVESSSGASMTVQAAPDGVVIKTGSFEVIEDKDVKKHKNLSIADVDMGGDSYVLSLGEITSQRCGSKAQGAKKLYDLSCETNSGFKVPMSAAIPFSTMEHALNKAPSIKTEYEDIVKALSNSKQCDERNLKRMIELVEALPLDGEIRRSVEDIFQNNERLMVRSSANCEDLEEMAGAGLYTSVPTVPACEVEEALKKVWASLWSRRAVLSRNNSHVPHDKVHMAVLIQEMITPDYSFIIHTVNPISGNHSECYIELALGLGETLASGAMRGVPYRMVCDKKSGKVTMLAFASFSNALWPDTETGISMTTVDYSRVALTNDPQVRNKLGKRLAQISHFVETALDKPQDIEGVITGNEIYLVQTRPQQGKFGS
jgi:phosphoglucan,water dikinase